MKINCFNIWALSLMPLHSNLAVSTTNNVNLVFNSTQMAKATNES